MAGSLVKGLSFGGAVYLFELKGDVAQMGGFEIFNFKNVITVGIFPARENSSG